VALSRSGVLAAWASAWLRGEASADDALSAVQTAHGDQPHRVVGLPDDPGPQPLTAALAHWRRSGAQTVLLALPAPGDVRGVPGPAPFRAAALESGEAAYGGRLALIPTVHSLPLTSAPSQVIWRAHIVDPAPADPMWLGDAERELAEAIRECAQTLSDAQAARWRPELSRQVAAARGAADVLPLPPRHPGRAVRLLAQAERLAAVLELADPRGPGDAVDLVGAQARMAALSPLVTAVRRARLAGYNVPGEDASATA
jgi:hypothetical protein